MYCTPSLIHSLTHSHTHVQASLAAVDTTDGAVADVVIPSRIELSKNYSIVSTENIPLALQAEEQQQHYP